MRSVLVLRHGKSDWNAAAGADHERPLATRGVIAAKRMGRFLQRNRQEPDRILSSTAARARATAELAVASGHLRCPVVYTDALYGASVASVLALVQNEDDSVARLLMVGHQPTWSALISDLTGGTEVCFPTAALARIDFETDSWKEIRSGMGTLRWLVTPKLLKKL